MIEPQMERISTFTPLLKVRESEVKEGKKWKIMIIEAGKSLNKTIYSRDVLVDAVKKFEGVKVHAYEFSGRFFDHITQADEIPQGYVGNLIGVIHNPRYEEVVEADGTIKEGIVGDLTVYVGKYRELFKNIWEEGDTDSLGFSVVIEAETERDSAGNIIVKKIDRVESVDVVSSPAAGGRLLKLLESFKGGEKMDKQKIIDAIKKLNPTLLEGKNIETLTDEELEKLLLEAIQKSKKEEKAEKKIEKEEAKTEVNTEEQQEAGGDIKLVLDKVKTLIEKDKKAEALTMIKDLLKKLAGGYGYPAPKKEGKELETLVEEINKIKSELTLEKKLNESNLPEFVKEKIKKLFESKVFTDEELDKVIKEEKETLAKLQESFGELKIGGQSKVEVLRSDVDKKKLALYNTLWGWNDLEGDERKLHESVGRFRGIRQAYIEITGDEDVSFGLLPAKRRLTEATSSDFATLLADVMNKRLAKEYPRLAEDTWRKLVSVVPLSDFNPQHIIRLGSLSELPSVSEGDNYQDWTVDTTANEEEATYTPGKKGRLYSVTREMIKSDRIKAIAKLPTLIARAANRTIMRFVFDLIINYGAGAINGGTIYDGKALYHADHNNLLSLALSSDALSQAKQLLFNQKLASMEDHTEYEVLGLRGKYLIVPVELQPTAEVLLKSDRIPGSPNNDVNIHKGTLDLIVSAYLRGDTNNWYLMADPTQIDAIEIGFVDGKDTPEILVQDNPLMGSGFTADKITYKVRLEFGGAIADYRAFVGSIVS